MSAPSVHVGGGRYSNQQGCQTRKNTWSSWRVGCPTGCDPLWVESERNTSRSRRICSGRPRRSWRRGCERRPAAPWCPSNEPCRSAASAHLGYRTDYRHKYRLISVHHKPTPPYTNNCKLKHKPDPVLKMTLKGRLDHITSLYFSFCIRKKHSNKKQRGAKNKPT